MKIPKTLHRHAGALALLLTLLNGLFGATAMAIEEPAYQVLETYPEFELRRYGPTLVAVTEVSGDFDGAGNQAFRRLADFIFGNNAAGEKIEMTAPVTQAPARGTGGASGAPSETITPEPQGHYRVSFVMPGRFTAETLPAPKDPGIQIRGEPPRTLAARRYSGRWTWENYHDNETVLLDAVRAAGLTPVGPTLYARYNAPFIPWFLRRNEVLVEVRDPRDGE
jgi:SOUL heme-binding protein